MKYLSLIHILMIWEKVGVIVMEDRYNGTVTAILEAGKKEFLTYGYEKASLRRIAKEASVTTGAIYGYFPGKKALFDALTSDTAEELLDLYRKEHRDLSLIHISWRRPWTMTLRVSSQMSAIPTLHPLLAGVIQKRAERR